MRFLRFDPHNTSPHPSRISRLLAGAALLIVASASPGIAQRGRADDVAIEQFQKAIDTYVLRHRQVEQTLAPMTVTADAAVLMAAIEARAEAMRRVRPEARQGELFTPAVAKVLRARIDAALKAHRLTAAEVVLEEIAEGNDELPAAMRVNGPFPWHAANGMLLCLTNALPELPEELQYRIVGRDLVLIDMPASMVVDILPMAFVDRKPTTIRF